MNVLTLDFETYFDVDYTLKKLTTEAYIRDPRFEALGLGVRYPDGRLEWVEGPQIRAWLLEQSWANQVVLCHHAHFDGLILSHHYNFKPFAWLDTLSMARLALGNHVPAGLGALAKHYNLAEKNVDYGAFKGRHLVDLTSAELAMLGEQCLHDCALTYEIFTRLRSSTSQEAFHLIDTTVRMFTEPKLIGDPAALATAQADEVVRKGSLLFALNVTAKELCSNTTFAALLADEGVEMEFKDGKNGPIPATAKTDTFMGNLLVDPNDRVVALAEARLACKSSIEETRAGRLLSMAQRGPLPVYLTFAGAHTTRWSGGDKVNFQNLPKSGVIRAALLAPAGCVIARVDARQQECRLLNTAAGQENIVAAFREGRDVYCELGPAIFGRRITMADYAERQVCKITELACGYRVSGKRLFFQMRAKKVPEASLEFGERAVRAYRQTHPCVLKLWDRADDLLAMLSSGDSTSSPYGLPFDIRGHKIVLPNGAPMHYELRWDMGSTTTRPGWVRKTRSGYRHIYGAALCENIFQALGAVAIGQSVLRIQKRLDLRPVLLEHDAGAWVVPADLIADVMPILIEEVGRAPSWLPNAPMDAEGTFGERYATN